MSSSPCWTLTRTATPGVLQSRYGQLHPGCYKSGTDSYTRGVTIQVRTAAPGVLQSRYGQLQPGCYNSGTGCSLNIVIFLNSASSAAALVFYLPGVCTHTDTEGKQRKARVRNILKSSEKTQYLMNTLYYFLTYSILHIFSNSMLKRVSAENLQIYKIFYRF